MDEIAMEREKSFRSIAAEEGLDFDKVRAALLAFRRWEMGDDQREDWPNCGYPGGVIAALVAVKDV
jgi:hypothetical protein